MIQSAAMTHTSWEVLKLKFQSRILHHAKADYKSDKKFVISFMGSSVTAGHDSPFNVSFPIITQVTSTESVDAKTIYYLSLLLNFPLYMCVLQTMMSPAFTAFNLTLETRNAAMGNNPCMPYDVCVRTFAGSDVDIGNNILWFTYTILYYFVTEGWCCVYSSLGAEL
jgi:hypothetical protein